MATSTIPANQIDGADFSYKDEPDETLTTEVRELFENYSKIPSSEVVPHIKDLRDKAWAVFPYPCIGLFHFIDISINSSRHFFSYPDLISSLKNGQTYLDIGCCVGQDIRKLVYDGAPSENIYASELRPEYIELGYELFRDKDSLKTKMIAPGNVYDLKDGKGGLNELAGKGGVDTIHASCFIHLFDYEGQIEVCTLLTKLLKNKKGSKIIGRQAGAFDGQAKLLITQASANGKSMWLQDPTSFRRCWDEVGRRTGTEGQWEVQSKVFEFRDWNGHEKLCMFWFSVERI